MELEIYVRVWEKVVGEMYYDVKRTYNTETKSPPPILENNARVEMHRIEVEDKNTEFPHYLDIAMDSEGKRWIIHWNIDFEQPVLMGLEGEMKEFPDQFEFSTYEILGNIYEDPHLL